MTYRIRARADKRALSVGLASGAAVGLLLGGVCAVGGAEAHMAAHRQRVRPAAIAPAPTVAPTAAPALLTGPAPAAASSRDLNCLADAVYYEARGESADGQAAIAQVVLNRLRHPAFPKTVCGVVFQGAYSRAGCQFSFACDGSMRRRKDYAAWDRAEQIAARALAGSVMPQIGGATHFHAISVRPDWGPNLMRVAQVGLHVFYSSGSGLRREPAPGADRPHAVYASMLPGLGGGDGSPKAAADNAAADLPVSPVSAPSVRAGAANKAAPDPVAAKPVLAAAPVS